MKKNQKITTCHRMDLETLGFWPKMLPEHCGGSKGQNTDNGIN